MTYTEKYASLLAFNEKKLKTIGGSSTSTRLVFASTRIGINGCNVKSPLQKKKKKL